MTQPFHFPDGRVANNAQDLLELCEQYPDDATGFLVRQDLEKWLAYIGSYDVAECATNARQIDVGDRQKLEDFLNKCHSLTASQPVTPAVTETNIEDNLTAPDSGTPIPEPPQAEVVDSAPATKPTEQAPVTPATPPETPPAPPKPVPSTSIDSETEAKPSFFQVVAKFIFRILYRDKA